ncbi:hypothetical protein [Beijerinckia sp. L45]|uniref:hypothetical protein n=1 Tax=Beijerinckia sp. L45 TaxID=1641855 RepID=UPI00131E9728|nr:hypothetical protein [Beijerinckia sp. L45]
MLDLLNKEATAGHNLPPTAAERLAMTYAELLADAEKIEDRAASLPAKVANDIDLGRYGPVVKDARALAKKLEGKRTEENEPHLTAQREHNAFFAVFTERLTRIAKDLEGRATVYNDAKAAEARRILADQARKAREEEDRQRQIAQEAAEKDRQGAVLRHEDRADEAASRAVRLEAAANVKTAELTRVRSDSGVVATSRTSWKGEVVDIGKIDLEKLRPYLPLDALQKALNAAVRMGLRDCPGTSIFQDSKASFR